MLLRPDPARSSARPPPSRSFAVRVRPSRRRGAARAARTRQHRDTADARWPLPVSGSPRDRAAARVWRDGTRTSVRVTRLSSCRNTKTEPVRNINTLSLYRDCDWEWDRSSALRRTHKTYLVRYTIRTAVRVPSRSMVHSLGRKQDTIRRIQPWCEVHDISPTPCGLLRLRQYRAVRQPTRLPWCPHSPERPCDAVRRASRCALQPPLLLPPRSRKGARSEQTEGGGCNLACWP